MKNRDFLELLRDEKTAAGDPFTIEKLAEGIYESRPHVNRVLLGYKIEGKPNYGRLTRRKLAKFFKEHFVTYPAMLAALGWNEDGHSFHMERDMENK